MKILIYGAGVVGCTYGWQLSKAGCDVAVLVRKEQKELVQKDGIRIICSDFYNPQIQISAESGTKRSNFRQKDKTKRSKKRLHTTLIKPEQKVNEDLCSGFIVS